MASLEDWAAMDETEIASESESTWDSSEQTDVFPPNSVQTQSQYLKRHCPGIFAQKRAEANLSKPKYKPFRPIYRDSQGGKENERQVFMECPTLFMSRTYYLNLNGLKQVAIGLKKTGETFSVSVILSHIRIPSKHLEMTLREWQELRSHFNTFRAIFRYKGENYPEMQPIEFGNLLVTLELMFKKPTISITDKILNTKFNFQDSTFQSLRWFEGAINGYAKFCERMIACWNASQNQANINLTPLEDGLKNQLQTELAVFGFIDSPFQPPKPTHAFGVQQ